MKALIKIRNILFGPVDNFQSGESLLSILVTLSISMVLIHQVNTVVRTTIVNRMHITLRKSKNDAKRAILKNMDCKSFNYSCSNNSLVVLRNFDGEVLVNNETNALNLSKYGRWSVRAVCQDNTPELQFALLHPTSGAFLQDPKTEKALNWSESVAVSQDELCRSEPSGLQVVVGDRCDREQKLVTNPLGLSGAPPTSPWFSPAGNICNPDGSDGDKPNCPAGTNEWYSYWDRDDDWGKNGSWVVACR